MLSLSDGPDASPGGRGKPRYDHGKFCVFRIESCVVRKYPEELEKW